MRNSLRIAALLVTAAVPTLATPALAREDRRDERQGERGSYRARPAAPAVQNPQRTNGGTPAPAPRPQVQPNPGAVVRFAPVQQNSGLSGGRQYADGHYGGQTPYRGQTFGRPSAGYVAPQGSTPGGDPRRPDGNHWQGTPGASRSGDHHDGFQPGGQPSRGGYDGRGVYQNGGQRGSVNQSWGHDAGRLDHWDTRGANTRDNDRYRDRDNSYRQNWSSNNWNGNNWSRDWRRDNRYDWQRYRYSNRAFFQAPRYYAPYGWNRGYERFSIGFSLSNIFFDQQYWIADPYAYRLPPAYGPYRWVRYYDDVLLVDLRSGQVVDAIYDFFW